jgi:SOS response regulatory protein OraA/RecX
VLEAIEQALLQVDDDAQQRSAVSVAEKYARQYARLPKEERDEMVIRRLLSRGYSYDDARAALREATEETEE